MGQEVDQELIVESTRTLHGGMNNRDKPWAIGENTAVLLENVDPYNLGVRSKRLGVQSVNGKFPRALGLSKFFDNSLGQEALIAAYAADTTASAPGELYIMNTANASFQVASDVSLAQTQYLLTEGRWRNTGNAMYVCTMQQHMTDPSIASVLGVFDRDRAASFNESMAPTVMTWFQNRLWVADNFYQGSASNSPRETMWWSQLGDGLSFSEFNTLEIEPGVGGRITGMIAARGGAPQLFIFKEESIHLFSPAWGNSSGLIPQPADALDFIATSLRTIAKNAGCVATGSITYVPGAQEGDIWFLARDGIRSIARASDDTVGSPAQPVSLPVQSTIDRINWSFAHLIRATTHDNRYFIALPLDGADTLTHVLSRDIGTGAWYLYTWKANALISGRLNETDQNLWMQYDVLSTDTVPGSSPQELRHIYKALTGSYDPSNSPIVYKETSRAYIFGVPHQRKKLSWVQIGCLNSTETSTFDVEIAKNNGSFDNVGTVHFPPTAVDDVVMGVTPLPWNSGDPELTYKKVGLEDVKPGYMFQLRLTSSSDFGLPQVVQTALAARVIDPEFDNELT